jgi:hypothetical protein
MSDEVKHECVGGPLDGEMRSFGRPNCMTVCVPEWSMGGIVSHYYCLTISVWPQGQKTWWSYRGTNQNRIKDYPVVEPAWE